jgi:oxygen-independent coproporphyrinogen-3 oxidase
MNVAAPDTERARARAAPRAAYIHVPFCRRRCGYCNFTLIAGRDDLVDVYLTAIERELQTPTTVAGKLSAASPPAEIDTLYFGGGTPTFLSTGHLRRLAAIVLSRHPLSQHYEWTVEANPEDVDPAMVAALAAMGVTRLSLGAQSFRDEKLRMLDRDHRATQIERAVALAKNAGIAVAIDLIFAAPGETLAEWQSDLAAAIALQPDHISTYGLTFEQGTAFWGRRLRGDLMEANESLQRDMYSAAIDGLAAAGFEHYEVSNFARPGRRSRHNQTYWSGDGYFAAGPGAARYVDGVRETNHRSTTTYIRRVLAGRSPVAEREQLDPEARARELLVLGLRRRDGICRREFAARSGYEADQLAGPALGSFAALGLVEDCGDRIRLTREGLYVSDAIWPELL